MLSSRINRLAESATLAMARKSRELKQQGIDIISLSLGEPDFNTPDFIKEAAKKAIDDNYTKYPPVNGYLELREAISRKFKRDNNLDYSPEQIVVSTGAKQSLANIVLSLIDKGDEVIIPAPYWVSYVEIVKLAEGEMKFIPATIKNDFKITPAQLENAIGENSKLIIFSTPCNPTGSFYSKNELEGLAQVIAKFPNLYVICDEIYEYINFSGKHASLAACSNIKEQVITVNGVSKGFAMTGWRLGYIGAPIEIAKACTKMQGQITSGANGIAQMAAKAAIEANPNVIAYMRDAFKKRRDLLLGLLTEISGIKLNIPEGAFYLFPDISAFFGKSFKGKTIRSAADLSLYLLMNAHVAIVSGEAFGDPNCIRFSYAASEQELIEAVKRIKSALNKLE